MLNRTALTIAGADPCSGAGLQRDLKTFHELGVYGLSVITLLTAQNTEGVTGIMPVPVDFVKQQLISLQQDFSITATKISLVYHQPNIQILHQAIASGDLGQVVIDPILSSSSGCSFFIEADYSNLISLLAQAALVTPNMPEAALLLGCSLQEISNHPEAAIKQLHQQGIKNLLLKGGHAEPNADGALIDYFSDGHQVYPLEHQSINPTSMLLSSIKPAASSTKNFHGTGCVLSAAITAYLAHGMPMLDAIKQAQDYLLQAMHKAIRLGKGAWLI